MITALCGGVGGSKLALGLYLTLPPDGLAVVANTADDLDFCGLHVSPDLDTIVYTLAGIARRDVGWGIQDDSLQALSMLSRYGVPDWFQVGDRDLATSVFRTSLLRQGMSLTSITERIARSLGVNARVLPMTDATVRTRVLVGNEWFDFQDYFVRRRHRDSVDAVRYDGVEASAATQEVLEAIGTAEAIVLVNSNPVLSILPILAVPGINDLVATTGIPRVAVSPIVGRDAVSGPAGELMRLIGQPSSAIGVAQAYLGVIDGIVIDEDDAERGLAIESLGLEVLCTNTLMRDRADSVRLAAETIEFARGLR